MGDRDHFAAAALTGLLASTGKYSNGEPRDYAATAYQFADAMLCERERAVPPAPSSRPAETRASGVTQAHAGEPVAWAVAKNGKPCHLSWTRGDAGRELNRLDLVSLGKLPMLEMFPLYRSPTLTDEEREALHWFAHYGLPEHRAATLRSLLERMT